MDNVDLNNSPVLTMDEITKLLFNNEFESDVQFLVEGKTLFSHSWELTKRSKVFREQFRGTVIGDNKLIAITDTTYEAFYQFLRFIYTDECKIETSMITDMLKLAVKYKIVKLKNKVLNLGTCYSTDLTLLEFILENKYEFNFNSDFDELISVLDELVVSDEFLKMKSIILEEILKSDRMPHGITEVKLFNNLVRWMNKSRELNGIPLSQRRSHFNHLLRLIRFPLMTVDEFNLCHENHRDLFTTDDISTICTQIVLKGKSRTTRWPAQPRIEYVDPMVWQNSTPNQKWITKFAISEDLIIRGLRFGTAGSDYEIQISQKNLTTNTATKCLNFNFEMGETYHNFVSFGETLKLMPNVDYMIEIKYKNAEMIYCRKRNVNLIITGPSDLITFKETSGNLFEMFLKLATN